MKLVYIIYLIQQEKEYTLFANNLNLLKEQQEPTAMQSFDIIFPRK